jgi:hypothetical protein
VPWSKQNGKLLLFTAYQAKGELSSPALSRYQPAIDAAKHDAAPNRLLHSFTSKGRVS